MLRVSLITSPYNTTAQPHTEIDSSLLSQHAVTADEAVQIKIDPASASLTELVRLAHLAASTPANAPLLAERVCTACWQPSRQVRLYFGAAPVQNAAQIGPAGARSSAANAATIAIAPAPAPAIAAAAELANETLAQLLLTTQAQLKLPDRSAPAAQMLRRYAQALGRARRPQTAAAFKRMVQITGEAVHREAASHLPPVRALTPQMPTDCMLHWISALRAARITVEGAKDPWLQQTEAAARRRWMQHDLTLAGMPSYFAQVQAECAAQGAIDLAVACRKIAATLPTAEQTQYLDTRLNDNLYGRVFETRLAARLMAAPLTGTLAFTTQLAGALRHTVSTVPPLLMSLVLKELCSALVAEPRFWFDRVPMLMHFITAPPGVQKKHALNDWLSTAPTSSYDCMAIVLCTGQLSLALKENAAQCAPWMRTAETNYVRVLQPATRRVKNMSQPLLRAEAGTLLLHQRQAFAQLGMRPGVRATLQHRPNFDRPSPAIKRALEHGLSYSSGVSGSTNLLLYCADHFRQGGIALDVRHLLLAATMLLSSGHSLHEVLWVAHQLDQPLGLGLALSDAAPDEFVADYDRFFDLFDDADRLTIGQAVAAAWNDTLDYAHLP